MDLSGFGVWVGHHYRTRGENQRICIFAIGNIGPVPESLFGIPFGTRWAFWVLWKERYLDSRVEKIFSAKTLIGDHPLVMMVMT